VAFRNFRMEKPRHVAAVCAALGVLIAAVLVVGGCGEGGPPPNVRTIALKLKGQGLPVRTVRVYTEETDPNKLLGRPGQYVGKAHFRDPRADSDDLKGLDVSEGGSIEVFTSADEAEKRAAYVEGIGKSGVGPFAEYDYRRGRVLLRIAGNLTPKQAREYERALAKAAPGESG
jgi:hypothetical protein